MSLICPSLRSMPPFAFITQRVARHGCCWRRSPDRRHISTSGRSAAGRSATGRSDRPPSTPWQPWQVPVLYSRSPRAASSGSGGGGPPPRPSPGPGRVAAARSRNDPAPHRPSPHAGRLAVGRRATGVVCGVALLFRGRGKSAGGGGGGLRGRRRDPGGPRGFWPNNHFCYFGEECAALLSWGPFWGGESPKRTASIAEKTLRDAPLPRSRRQSKLMRATINQNDQAQRDARCPRLRMAAPGGSRSRTQSETISRRWWSPRPRITVAAVAVEREAE